MFLCYVTRPRRLTVMIIGSRAASFERPLLSVEVSVYVWATLMLNISETKRFRVRVQGGAYRMGKSIWRIDV